jgi:NadR type nicotinamide-nucleotide adenylyltransferase
VPTLPPLLRIVVSGSESTGKTTLARELAAWLGTAWVPEHSRTYAESVGRPLTAADVEPIARGTIAAADAAEDRARETGREALVLDTDLASTLVYAQHYYGLSVPWIEAAWHARRPALYLLCHPDVPWVPDGVRDQPRERERLHALFAACLATSGAPVADVRGAEWAARTRVARDAVERVLVALGRPHDGADPRAAG